MKISREWVTPLTIGAFGLMATTGVLMFFHLDTGLNKEAHEWLGWLMVAAVAGHAAVNFTGFKRYFGSTRGRVILGAAALVLAASFIAPGASNDKPPFARPVAALSAAPLPVLAEVAGVSTDEVRSRLAAAGYPAGPEVTTLRAAAGPELRAQLRALNAVLKT